MLSATREWLTQKKNEGYKAAVIDAPLLYESTFDKECDFVIAVLAPASVRISRIITRDGISEAAAKARINAQPTDDFYTERANFVIQNDGDKAGAVSALESILASQGLLSDIR